MATWHGYLHVGELPPGWTVEQRTNAQNAMRGLQAAGVRLPRELNHSRLSLDSKQMIVEAKFDAPTIERAAVVPLLAGVLGITDAAVNARLDYTILGGLEADWETSRQAALALIAGDLAAWEPEEA